jgi:hypothetical protein
LRYVKKLFQCGAKLLSLCKKGLPLIKAGAEKMTGNDNEGNKRRNYSHKLQAKDDKKGRIFRDRACIIRPLM